MSLLFQLFAIEGKLSAPFRPILESPVLNVSGGQMPLFRPYLGNQLGPQLLRF